MKTFKLIISSPEGNVFDGEATMLSLRGIEGELAVMAGHVPFITVIVVELAVAPWEIALKR